MSINLVKDAKNKSITCYVEGEINIDSSPEIKKILTKLIAKKTSKITVNFTKVTYIDSSGLGMLIEMLKEIHAYGGKLELSGLIPRIKNIIEIKKLDKVFDIV